MTLHRPGVPPLVFSAVVLCVILFPGCANNAVLEVSVTFPPMGTVHTHASIQIRRASSFPFPESWAGDDPSPVELRDVNTADRISVESMDDDIDVHVKVRFCTSRQCIDNDSPELWFFLEDPFYVGERTRWSTVITSIPTGVPEVEPMVEGDPGFVARCDIAGCRGGDVSISFCRNDGTHFCQ